MRIPSPTSRSHKRIYLSLWHLTWAVGSPLLALYLRDPTIHAQQNLAFFAPRTPDGFGIPANTKKFK
jgi:hypothetical protein